MPVPATIAAQVSALNSALTAARNLNAASFETLNALAWRAGTVASDVEASIDGQAGALDTFTAPLMPADIVSGVLGLLDASTTQATLGDLEGFVARIEINLENRS